MTARYQNPLAPFFPEVKGPIVSISANKGKCFISKKAGKKLVYLYEHIESSFAKATKCAVICEHNFSKVEFNCVAPTEHTKPIICEGKRRKTGFGVQL